MNTRSNKISHKVEWEEFTHYKEFRSECGFRRFKLKLERPFPVSCRKHDFCYSRGGCEYDRMVADLDFFNNLYKNAHVKKWWWSTLVLGAFVAVRVLGRLAFTYGDYLTADQIIEDNRKKFKK